MKAMKTWTARRAARREAEEEAHPTPVLLDLGSELPWKVDIVLADLVGRGLRVQPPGNNAFGGEGGAGRTYTVLVHPDDLDAVCRALTEADVGFR